MRQVINRLLNRIGYELRRSSWEGWHPEKLQPLSVPATVIDVGVASGTPKLYAAFPDANLLLIEPLHVFEQSMQQALTYRRGSYELAALGDHAGMGTLHIATRKTGSSLYHRTNLTHDNPVVDQQSIPIKTLDSVIKEHGWPGPYLLKIDAEGHELPIIKGGGETLAQTDCVIAEVSVGERFVSSYRFAEFIRALDDRGFDLIDILTLARGKDTKVRHVDAAFTRSR